MMMYRLLLLLVVLLLFVTPLESKIVKSGKKKKKRKSKKKANSNAFKNTMRKAANRKKEKEQLACSHIVKAAREGRMDFLKPGGANLDKKQRRKLKLDCLDEVGYSPLHHAGRKGQNEFLKTLLEMQAKVDIENTQAGWTPMFESAYWGQTEAVNLLLKAGANPNHMSKTGQNSLHIACQGRYGNEGTIVKTLITAGAHVDTTDVQDRTPLFDAAENGCLECAKALVKFGASPTAKDVNGKTPMGHASRLGFSDMLAFFHKHERGPSDDEHFDHTPESVEDVDMPPIVEEEGEMLPEDEDVEEVIEL